MNLCNRGESTVTNSRSDDAIGEVGSKSSDLTETETEGRATDSPSRLLLLPLPVPGRGLGRGACGAYSHRGIVRQRAHLGALSPALSPGRGEGGRRLAQRLERAIPRAFIHIRFAHLDAVLARVPHDLRRLIETHRL